jgi:hypothetical protein
MSKLCDRIDKFQNYRNVSLLPPSDLVELREGINAIDFKLGYEIELGLKISYGAVIEDIGDIERVRKEARLAVAEDIFGEFRNDLIKLKHAVIKRDYTEANNILDSLYDKMFKV